MKIGPKREKTLLQSRPRLLSPTALGGIFLSFGLLWGIPALITGTFNGAAMGFCIVAVLGGLLMMVLPSTTKETTQEDAG